MLLTFSKRFAKQRDKVPRSIQIALRERIKLFSKDLFHPLLKNHALIGQYKGYRSINVTGDWRAIYSERKINDQKIIIFEILGTHSELYQ